MLAFQRPPWTFEELKAVAGPLREKIDVEGIACELENPDARPLPPMTVEEAREMLICLVERGANRQLTRPEMFLHGQLLACFEMAVRAETLGKPGRYFVISEQQINDLCAQHGLQP